MRVYLAIGALLVGIGIELGYAQSRAPESGTQLVQLCNQDLPKCQTIIGVIVKTGVDGDHLPSCLASLDPQVLSQHIIDWWKQNPKQAENPVVLAVAFALRALKPC